MSDRADEIAMEVWQAAGLDPVRNRALIAAALRSYDAEIKAERDRLREALKRIRDDDKQKRLRTIEIDPAGNTYEIEEIDGPWARIARAALSSPTPEGGGG